jgi:hypothetical protein
VVCVIFFALKGVLSRILRDILKPIYFTVKDVVSAPGNAGLEPLPWWKKKNNGQEGRY